jgi:LEA14-like dessication related protein
MTRFVPRAVVATLLAMLFAAASSSCAFLSRQAFAPPIVAVRDVRLTGIGVQGGHIDVKISIYNPNDYRLDARAIHYRMFVDTLQLAEGTIDEHLELRPRDSIVTKVPVTFGLRQVMTAGTELTKTGTLPFRLTGDLLILTALGSVHREFEELGTYDGVNISLLPHKKK